jgi:hypothetical protein
VDGGARSAPPTHGAAALEQAAETERLGPIPLTMAVSKLGGLAFSNEDRQTRNAHRLAFVLRA